MADRKSTAKRTGTSAKRKSAAKRTTAKRKSTAPRKSTAKRTGPAPRARQTVPRASDALVCSVAWCPICQAATAAQGAPDVAEHLMGAAREFLLAAKAMMEAMPKPPTPASGSGRKGENGQRAARRSGTLMEKISVS